MNGRVPGPAGMVIERRSPTLWRFTVPWFARFFGRHMNALRIARWGEPPEAARGAPLVVYSNHPAWWDAAVYILLGAELFPERACYAPIDAAMLDRYRFFGRIGAFGIDLASPRGAADFLRTGREVLSRPERSLWVTAQGRFVDSRERPVGLRAGIARLAELAPEAGFVPLAIEYSFWTERGAEALVAFGPLRRAEALRPLERKERLEVLERDLDHDRVGQAQRLLVQQGRVALDHARVLFARLQLDQGSAGGDPLTVGEEDAGDQLGCRRGDVHRPGAARDAQDPQLIGERVRGHDRFRHLLGASRPAWTGGRTIRRQGDPQDRRQHHETKQDRGCDQEEVAFDHARTRKTGETRTLSGWGRWRNIKSL